MASCVLIFGCCQNTQTADLQDHTIEKLSVEKNTDSEQENQILFWIAPQNCSDYTVVYEIYKNGVENKDLSDTWLWNDQFAEYGTEDVDFEYIPVTYKEFATTKNAKMKILRHAYVWIDFKKSSIDFRGWTLDSVSFMRARNISECDFTDAKISYCNFHNTEVTSDRTSEGKWIVRLMDEYKNRDPNENRLTFEQFASTASYRANDLRGIRLAYVNLSDWNFEGKDISTMIFSDCYYKDKKVSGTGLTPDFFTAIDQEIKKENAESH